MIETVHLTQKQFDNLLEYSLTNPTGVTIGKQWKRRRGDNWYLCEYVKSEQEGYADVVTRLIVIPSTFNIVPESSEYAWW